MLAVKELLGSKLKFGLIALVIGLVVSLTFIMSAMSEGLITGMTGAKGLLDADALVFQGDTYLSLERSRLTAQDLETIAAAPGVERSYGVGHAMATIDATSAEERFDARVFGLGARFEQLPVVEGSGEPGPGEAVVDITAQADGVALGDTLLLKPIDEELTVVGFTQDRRYIMTPAIYVDLPTWERAADAAGASIAAVDLADGVTIERLAEQLAPDYDVATPEEAALAGNGMPVMILAVDGIQVVSLVIGALVIGVFFYVTTLGKTGQIAAIKALGATNAFVFGQLILQITILVAIASAFGIALTLATGASMPPTMAFDPQPARWAVSLALVFAFAYLGSLFSLRSILAIDPATALDRTEH